MKSPVSNSKISPGTTFLESVCISFPPLMSLAWGAESFFKASMAFSALFSCITPIMAFSTTINKIITESI